MTVFLLLRQIKKERKEKKRKEKKRKDNLRVYGRQALGDF